MKPWAKLPRLSLGCFPTPLVEAKHLSEVLAGPRILIKRDDLTGLALGGNKCRRLEFLMGYARERGLDSFLISGIHNYTAQLAAATAKVGFKVRQIIHGDVSPKDKQGNYVLHRILNSDIKVIEPISPDETPDNVTAKRNAALESEAVKLREEGYNPFVIRAWESTPVENIGWVDAVDEICQQLKEQNIEAQYLITTISQGGTHAGLVLGTKYLGNPFKVIGISEHYTRAEAIGEVVRMTNETAEFLELGISITPNEVTIHDEYTGDGYLKPTKESIEAIKLVAQTEGFFLDPVYTGKAMAGLIDLIRKGEFTAKDTVVFIHTGGIPYLFVYPNAFNG